jgi:hypothetical protein
MYLEHTAPVATGHSHPLDVSVVPALNGRNRLTSAFRIILALPHLILVGGPVALGLSGLWPPHGEHMEWTTGGGLLGAAAVAVTVIAWFAIIFTGRMPAGLWNFSVFYLRWRVRAASYVALLRDEYPPFGEDFYFAELAVPAQPDTRDRVSVAFRMLLVVPHLIIVWLLGVAWCVATVIAWFAILLTGKYPAGLYDFSVGVLRWSTNVEAYLLLLHDEFPPFSLQASR